MLEMKNRTEANGGATMETATGEFDVHADGYYVGGIVKGQTFPLEGSHASDYVMAAFNIIDSIPLGTGAIYLGSWVDTETGTVWIDASEHYSDREEALQIAADRGELAIWDITANEEVRVP